MFEGYIAGKFADKMFEKEVFSVIRWHSFFAALIMMFPDFGLGTLFFIGLLWHMYSSICKKVGISFSEHFWSLVGVGIIINIVVALIIDIVFSFLFFLEGFIIYFQFYLSGKFFVESVKELDSNGWQLNTNESDGTNGMDEFKKFEAPKEYDLPKQDKIKTESEAPKEYHVPKKNIEPIIFKEPVQPKAKQEITIGRSESCDIRFDENDVFASTYHGSIFMDGKQLMFKDTSTNGTVINKRMVRHTTVPINRGDSIIIADKYPISWSQINAFFPPPKTYQQTVPITNEDRQRYEVPQQASPSPICSPNYQSQPQQDISQQREATLFCPYCGKEIPASVSYCVYCNRPIPSNLSKRLH
jgi:hypothetical protein